MFVIRETLIAKPGMASKLAKLIKEALASHKHRRNVRVLTDMVADMNCVVLESEVPSLEEFQKSISEYASDTEIRAKMKGYTDMYVSGRREIYQVM